MSLDLEAGVRSLLLSSAYIEEKTRINTTPINHNIAFGQFIIANDITTPVAINFMFTKTVYDDYFKRKKLKISIKAKSLVILTTVMEEIEKLATVNKNIFNSLKIVKDENRIYDDIYRDGYILGNFLLEILLISE